MPYLTRKFNSTYGLHYDWSRQGEQFYSITIHWKYWLAILKIRIAPYKSKRDRTNQAIFYYDVRNREEADIILNQFKDFNFKKIESWFEKKIKEDNPGSTTGEVDKWLIQSILPEARKLFIKEEYLLNNK